MSSKAPLPRLQVPRPNITPVLALSFFVVALLVHTAYISHLVTSTLHTFRESIQSSQSTQPTQSIPSIHLQNVSVPTTTPPPLDIPPLFIYRRTRKTGSSSMLDALLRALEPFNYKPLYHYDAYRMAIVVRAEMIRTIPTRIFVAQHNHVTRAHAAGRRTVIADTFTDGYKQITSFCRFVKQVKNCDTELADCLRSKEARAEMTYRWGGRPREDDDTYIDLPLSSAHPALSTTVLRRVYPNVTLDVHQFNVVGSSCNHSAALRLVYDQHYANLEKQISHLRGRLLNLAGYPAHGLVGHNLTVVEMLDAAEVLESQKYLMHSYNETAEDVSKGHQKLKLAELAIWQRTDTGIVLK